MKKKTEYLAKAAVIAALYVALTYASGPFAYRELQFRLSEALTILPIFCPAAIPGLTVGCLLSNITSTVSPMDMVLGTAATLIACIGTRALRNVRIKGYPLLSFLCPVAANAVIVGALIAFFTDGDTFWHAYPFCAAGVAVGEIAVIFVLGTILFFFIEKSKNLKTLLS